MTINDRQLKFLRNNGYTGSINDAYRKYLSDQVGTTTGSIDDLLYTYLKDKWKYTGSLSDMLSTHLRTLGYTGSLSDMLRASWNSSGVTAISFSAPFNDKGSGEVNTAAFGLGSTTPTFTRATSATTFDSTGSIISVASGIPRSYYDPTTLQYRGYLSEPSRTNLVLNSLINGTDFSTQSVAVTAVAHTLSFYGTGTITLSGASTAGPLVGTGVYPQRVTLTFTPTVGTLTLTVSGSCKYVQLETSNYATSFIPTASTSVVRNADVLTYPFASNTSATNGTAYAEFMIPADYVSTDAVLPIGLGTGATNAGMTITTGTGATRLSVSDGSNTIQKTGLTSVVTGQRKRAINWGGTTMAATGDGASVQGGSFDGNIGSTAIGIGCTGNGVTRGAIMIKNVRIYSYKLIGAQLQGITT